VITDTVFSRNRLSHAGQFEAAIARCLANFGRGQISSPTERISSMALLFRTTPGRMQ
jgi:hypothetical protein